MRNQEYMMGLRPDDCYEAMDWLMNEYGKRYTNAPLMIKCWLAAEATIGEWQRINGYLTAGGESVYMCSRCGGDQHIYGDGRHTLCRQCGCFNIYGFGGTRSDAEDTDTYVGWD